MLQSKITICNTYAAYSTALCMMWKTPLFKKIIIIKWRDIRWPILRICALHLTHAWCTHTAVNTHTPWTHTRSSGQPFMLRLPGSIWGFGALLKGTSVVISRVERALEIHSPPHRQSLQDRDSNPQPFNYESDSLTIRPRLPHYWSGYAFI